MALSNSDSIITATKWSFLAEISAKIIVPVTNIILARIIAPEVFGIIATINMITSLAEVFSSAGFQKYLIQHHYDNENDLYCGTNTAFWANLFLIGVIWFFIVLFRNPIAIFVGNEGYGFEIAVASFSLFVTGFSSIQESLFSKNLNYKVIFQNRIIQIICPFFITIPLAFFGYGHWALIIGTIVGNVLKAINLTIHSNWKPSFYFQFKYLKEMFSFSIWTFFESIAIWLTNWIDIFIISNSLGNFYTGIYKNSQTTVSSILSIITASVNGVFFSAIAKVQDNEDEFKKTFFVFQKGISIFVLPLGLGIFLFSKLITIILLGDKWLAGSNFIGIWGLCMSWVAVYGTFSRESYRAKGLPKLSLFVQILNLAVVIPVCIIGTELGFNILIYLRSFAYAEIILIHSFFMKKCIGISFFNMFVNTKEPIISTIVMGFAGILLLQINDSIIFQFLIIFICICVYFLTLFLFKDYRNDALFYIHKIRKKLNKKL